MVSATATSNKALDELARKRGFYATTEPEDNPGLEQLARERGYQPTTPTEQAQPQDEDEFQQAYTGYAAQTGVSPDPDDPRHFYDYRGHFRKYSHLEPDETGHLSSEFKLPGHPTYHLRQQGAAQMAQPTVQPTATNVWLDQPQEPQSELMEKQQEVKYRQEVIADIKQRTQRPGYYHVPGSTLYDINDKEAVDLWAERRRRREASGKPWSLQQERAAWEDIQVAPAVQPPPEDTPILDPRAREKLERDLERDFLIRTGQIPNPQYEIIRQREAKPQWTTGGELWEQMPGRQESIDRGWVPRGTTEKEFQLGRAELYHEAVLESGESGEAWRVIAGLHERGYQKGVSFGEMAAMDQVMATDVIPFVGSGIRAFKLYQIYKSTKRLEKHGVDDYDRRRADERAVIDYLTNQYELSQRGTTFGAKVGAGLLELPAFIGEFAATGGLAKLGEKAVAKGAEKITRRKLGQQVIKWVLTRPTRAAFRAAGMPTRIARSGLERALGETPVEQGRVKTDAEIIKQAEARARQIPEFVALEEEIAKLKHHIKYRQTFVPDKVYAELKSLQEARSKQLQPIAKTIQRGQRPRLAVGERPRGPISYALLGGLDTIIETYTEELGTLFSRMGSRVIKRIPGLSRLQAAWSRETGGAAAEFARKMMRVTGRQDILSELGEEQAGRMLREFTGLDRRAADDATLVERFLATFPSAKELAAEATVLGVPSLLGVGGQVIGGRPTVRQRIEAARGILPKEVPIEEPIETEGEAEPPRPAPPGEAEEPVRAIIPTPLEGIEGLKPTDKADAETIVAVYQKRSPAEPLTPESITAVDTAFETAGLVVPTDMPDVQLRAWPGNLKAMQAIAQKMRAVRSGKITPTYGLTRRKITPTKLPKAKAKTPQAQIKSLLPSKAKEMTRYAIDAVHIEGDKAVVTDGRRLWIIEGEWGPDGDYAVDKKGNLGELVEGEFPKYQDVIPSSEGPPTATVEIEPTFRRLAQAATMTTEEFPAVLAAVNPDGTMGFAVLNAEAGTVEVNIQDGYKDLGATNPKYLREALAFAYANNQDNISLWWEGPDKPWLLKAGNTTIVQMPMAMEKITTVADVLPVERKPTPAERIAKARRKEPEIEAFAAEVKAREWTESLPLEPEAIKKPLNAREILQGLSKSFNVPIRGKGTHALAKVAGFYKPFAQVIRLKGMGSLYAGSHELGHHLEKMLWGPSVKDIWGRAHFRKYTDELVKLDYRYPKLKRSYEGFAEYIRILLTTNNAAEVAPRWHDYFINEVLPAHPEIQEKLFAARQQMQQFVGQGAEARMKGMVDTGKADWERITALPGRAWRRFQQMFITDLAIPRYLLRQAGVPEAATEPEGLIAGKIAPSDDPLTIATALGGSVGAQARQFYLEGAFDLARNKVGPGIPEILAPVTQTLTKEAGKKEFTIYLLARRALKSRLFERHKDPGFSKTDAEHVYKKYDNPVWAKASGQITDWGNSLMDLLVQAGQMPADAARLIRALNPVWIRFARDFGDAIGHTPTRAGVGREIPTKAKGVHRLKGSARKIEDPFQSLATYAEQIISIANKAQVARAWVNLADKYEGLGHLIEEVPQPMKAVKFNLQQLKDKLPKLLEGVLPEEARSYLAAAAKMDPGAFDKLATIWVNSPTYTGKENIVGVMKNGKLHFYEFNPDLFSVLRNLDGLHMGPLMRIVSIPKRMVQAGAVSLNPAFMFVRNPARDIWTFTYQTEHAKLGPLSAAHAFGQMWQQDWRHYKARAGGLELAGIIGESRRMAQELSTRAWAEAKGTLGAKLLAKAQHPLDAIKDLGTPVEMAPRMAEFAAAAEKWPEASMDQFLTAMAAGRDVTVNFNRAGTVGRLLNQAIPFFNARIQGVEKFIRFHRKHPVRSVLTGMGLITLPQLLLWWKNKDEEWWKETPYWSRMFWVPLSDKWYIRWPQPFLWGYVYGAIPVMLMDSWYQDDPEQRKYILEAFFKELNPLDAPAIIAPAVDIATNKTWTGAPVVPERLKRVPPEEQYKDWTPAWARAIGKTFGWSPLQIEHWANVATGGMERRIAFDLERLRKLRKGLPLKASDLPIVGTLFSRNVGKPLLSIEQFYTRLEKLRIRNMSDVKPPSTAELVELYQKEKIAGELKELRDAIRIARKRDDPNEEARLYQIMGGLLREALKRKVSARDIQKALETRVYKRTTRVKGRLRRKGAPHKGAERAVAILRGRPAEEVPKRRPE